MIVTTNMYGDILSDEASEITGSLGLAASLNAGDEFAMAQAQHGSAPDIAGMDRANPASLIGSAAMLFRWLGERRGSANFISAGDAIDAAIAAMVALPANPHGRPWRPSWHHSVYRWIDCSIERLITIAIDYLLLAHCYTNYH